MILEHEIPNGSKLYFGESAKVKRRIENIASEVLDENGFQEIVTPIFSYHQHQSISDVKELIKVNDEKNNSLSLRADSTIDVVRIIEKRLGANTKQKKWFYIQPVVTYPTTEQYQVGVEFMGEKKLSSVMSLAAQIFDKLDTKPLVQISNIKIPEIQYVEGIDEVIAIAPDSIKIELNKIKELCSELKCENSVIAPMYYAKMLYYDELFFRVIDKNEVYARGGRYKNAELTSVGFAIYTDALCETLTK